MQTRAIVGLGSNLGDRRRILDGAIDALAATSGIELIAPSPLLETAPIGGPVGQGPFLNAAAEFLTSLQPEAFHAALKEIEERNGRQRLVRWGERTLDLDLLLFGDEVIETDRLVVPHPRMAFRRFVLEPVSALAPTAIHPITGRTVADLLANLDSRPLRVGLFGWDEVTTSSFASVCPGYTAPVHLEDLKSDNLRSLQILVAPRTSRGNIALNPDARTIPTLWLDADDPERAKDELLAACLSAR